ncbi:MAG: hypothetical protein Q4F66_01660 [Clostridium sp.]|nr:hypothetical protein [Clostridium sp.]
MSYKPIISEVNTAFSSSASIEKATELDDKSESEENKIIVGNNIYFNNIRNTFTSELNNIDSVIKSINNTINENIYSKYKMIESYGYIQKLMCKNEVSDFEVIRDKEGLMNYSYFADGPNPVDKIGDSTKRFKDNIKDKDVKVIYVMPPDKYLPGKTRMYKGLPYNYANETADNFLKYISDEGIDYIDLRNDIIKSPKNLDELFYKTDHHWRIETAFDEFVSLAYTLRDKYDADISSLDYFADKDNYNFVTYKNSSLGSMGRKTGAYYDGIDDFTVIFPKFKTKYSFYSKTGENEFNMEGRFEDVLINAHSLNYDKNIYSPEADKYASYLMGNQGIVHIKNENNKDGMKVMFIKDSYTVPLAAFLSTAVSDVYMIDPRYYDGDIVEYVNNTDLDMVMISFYPQSLTGEFFRF